MRLCALRGFFLGSLALGLWVAPAAAQDAAAQAALTARIEAKRMEIRHHTELIQAIRDPVRLQSETQKHFLMIEEMLALVLEQERQALQGAAAPSTGAMGGMEGEDAMEMPSGAPPAGGAAGMTGGMPGGVGDDAMEMTSEPQPSGAPPAGSTGGMGGHEMMGMGGMKAGAAADPASMAAASAAARRIAEREALLKEIDSHSAYLATVSDRAIRARETIRHQEMLDRLLELMR